MERATKSDDTHVEISTLRRILQVGGSRIRRNEELKREEVARMIQDARKKLMNSPLSKMPIARQLLWVH